MTADDVPAPDPSEGVFDMDPQAVLVDLARTLVNGHTTMLESQRAIERARSVQDAAPEAAEQLIAAALQYEHDWHTSTYPALLASMRLALEVYDTFGPGHTHIDDTTEAAIWNNKWFVWAQEFSEPGE